jgi:hypothetical protein
MTFLQNIYLDLDRAVVKENLSKEEIAGQFNK